MNQVTRKRSPLKRAARILLKTVLFVLLFFLIIILLILTPPVQNFLKQKAVAYLEKKLETKVSVGRIFIGFPKKVVVEDVYVEDRQKDTLLSAGSLKVDIALFKLIFNGEVNINKAELANSTIKLKRQLPDTAFNFQFVIDAFTTPGDPNKPKDTSATAPLVIKHVVLDKIRLVYKDVVTGNDVEGWLTHFSTDIDKIDPDKMAFDIPSITIEGLKAKVYQSKPLAQPEPVSKDRQEAQEPVNLDLGLKQVRLEDIQLDYRNDVSALYTAVKLDKSELRVNKIDLPNQLIDVERISLETTDAALVLGKQETARIVAKETKQEIETRTEAGWRFYASEIIINDNNLRFENENEPEQKTGMDYAHLRAAGLTLHVSHFVLAGDSIGGTITKGAVKEKSGFELQELKGEFLYTSKGASLTDLYLKTPGTELKRDATIRYASPEALQQDIGNMQIDADIEDSRILVKDVLVFAPMLRSQPAFANPSATWYVNARVRGRVADLQIDRMQVTGLRDTKIDISGRLAGLPDMKNAAADLTIRNLSSSRRDITSFVPASMLPQNITLPGRIAINGKARGNLEGMFTDLTIKTDLGNATVNGKFIQFDNPQQIKYDAYVRTASLDIGTILQQPDLTGPLTALVNAKGTGVDPKTANAVFTGKIESVSFKQYTYRDLQLNGSLADQKAKANAAIVDPNIHFALNAEADLSTPHPAVMLDATIDSIKMQPLHLASNNTIFRGKLQGNFPVTDPNALRGNLFITDVLLVRDEDRLQLDTVSLTAGTSDTGQYLTLKSDILYAELTGQYQLDQLGNIFQQAIQPYFAIGAPSSPATAPYDFRLSAWVYSHPALKAVIPNFEKLDSVYLKSHFTSNGWSAQLAASTIDIGTSHVRHLHVDAGTTDSARLNVRASLGQFSVNGAVELNNTTITASLFQNTIDFLLNIKDREQKDKYNLAGSLQQPAANNYVLSFQPGSLLLNYNTWNISEGNKVIIAGKNINASNLQLTRGTEQLTIHSQSERADAPMEANFTNFRLATLTGLIQPDTAWADGNINGKLTLVNFQANPVFTADLTVNEFRLKNDTVGDIRLLVNNKVSNTYNADITLSGKGNDVRLSGDYTPLAANNFDFILDIRQLPLTTARALSGSSIKDVSGNVNGRFTVNGTLKRPEVNGNLNFDKAAFTPSMLNSPFLVDNEQIRVSPEGINFDNFALKDSAGNRLSIDGIARTTNFVNYEFDMSLRANNFRALNSTKKDNDLFWGQLYFSTRMTVKGTEKLPLIDGRLTVNEDTKMTVVLPQRDPGISNREGVVEFVDMDAPLNDSLFITSLDSIGQYGFTGMEVSMIIEVDKEADLTMVVDEGNGDFLNVKGEAMITTNIDRTGEIIMSGTYELESGAYELSFNFLRRRFDIQQGSRITWEGEPTKATVDVTAKYIANVAPLDLVKSQLDDDASVTQRNIFLQRLPFDVILKMEGELLQPKITFDIVLPDNKSYVVPNDVIATVRTKLEQLRQEEGEMNKQVFSLLLLNRFVAENPFASSDHTTASSLARASVSKLLTEQLNKIAADLISGVEVNFDVQSSQDYTTGRRADRTDLNVGLSKQLLNDRLTVTVGSNFELEGPQGSNQQSTNIAGNVALDYKISRDGRYLLRAYRKNEYQGIIDGYVIETGVGFVITIDYNRFRQLFESRRRQREERIRRRQERARQEASTTQVDPVKQP